MLATKKKVLWIFLVLLYSSTNGTAANSSTGAPFPDVLPYPAVAEPEPETPLFLLSEFDICNAIKDKRYKDCMAAIIQDSPSAITDEIKCRFAKVRLNDFFCACVKPLVAPYPFCTNTGKLYRKICVNKADEAKQIERTKFPKEIEPENNEGRAESAYLNALVELHERWLERVELCGEVEKYFEMTGTGDLPPSPTKHTLENPLNSNEAFEVIGTRPNTVEPETELVVPNGILK